MNYRNKAISLFLSVMLVCGLVPQLAFAAVGDAASSPKKATVTYHLQDAASEMLVIGSDVEVSSDEAESLGFADSVADGVSALDVLVKAHEDVFGMTKDDASDYLAVSGSGYVTKLFGQETTANSFMLNGGYPNDGTESAYGGYNGTTVTTQGVSSGDALDFFIYQDQSAWGDQAAWFNLDGAVVDTITVAPGSSTKLVLKGASYMMGYLYKDASALHNAGQAVSGAQLAAVDAENDTWADVAGATANAAGELTVAAPQEEGTYYYTVHTPANGANPVIPPVLKVVVSNDAPAPASSARLTALSVASFESNPGSLEMSPAFSSDVAEYSVPEIAWNDSFLYQWLYVKASAPEGAVITASLNGGAAKQVTSGAGAWTIFNGSDVLKRGDNTLAVTVAASADADAEAKTYTVTVPVEKEAPSLSFNVTPSDAAVRVVDADGNEVAANNGAYAVEQGKTYTYTVTKAGYVAKRDTVTVDGATSVSVALDKAADSSRVNFDSEWPSFRNSNTNMGITNAATPRSTDESKLLWGTKMASGWMDPCSSPIIVGDYLYVMVGANIKKVDKKTGEVKATAAAAASGGYTVHLAYGDGMIFAPVSNGQIQAFNADTLESLWVSEPMGGQTLTPITYANGYVYTGFAASGTKATFVCLSATDEDPAKTDEVKYPTWVCHGPEGSQYGYYWSGACVVGDVVVFGSDTGVLTSYSATQNKVIDTFQAEGDIRCSIAREGSTLYFTTKAGKVYSIAMSDAGVFDDASAKSGQASGVTESTCTPVVHNGRVYVGGGGSSFSKGTVAVMDAATMQTIYFAEVGGKVQSSALLSTAYEADGGKVYAYFTYNNNPGGIVVLEDAPGQTEAKVSDAFVPEGAMAQYCICSPICDMQGTIYYKNDSGYLMAIGVNAAYEELKAEVEGVKLSASTGLYVRETDWDDDYNDVTVTNVEQTWQLRMKDSGVAVSVVKSDNPNIASDGTVTFTSDEVSGNVSFRFQKNGATYYKETLVTVPAHIMTTQEQADHVAGLFAGEDGWLYIKGTNGDKDAVTEPLNLQNKVSAYGIADCSDVELSWTSDNEDVIKPSSYGSASVKVNRPANGQPDAVVTLTVKVSKTKYADGPCEPREATIQVKVPAVTDQELAAAKEVVDNALRNVTLEGFVEQGSLGNAPINPEALDFDGQLKSVSDLIAAGMIEDTPDNRALTYAWSTDSQASEGNYLAVSNYGFKVYRTVGCASVSTNLKLSLTFDGYTGTKVFPVTIKELTQSEVDAAKAEMAEYEAAIWDGLKADNPSKDFVTSDLGWDRANNHVVFYRMHKEDGKVVYTLKNGNCPSNTGVEFDSWKSSDPTVIGQTTGGYTAVNILKVLKRPALGEDDFNVTISSNMASLRYKNAKCADGTPAVPDAVAKLDVVVPAYTNDLASLSINGQSVDLSSGSDSYTVEVPAQTSSLSVVALAKDPAATVAVNGQEVGEDGTIAIDPFEPGMTLSVITTVQGQEKTVAVTVSVAAPAPDPEPVPEFSDVDYSAWYGDGVTFVAEKRLMTGYEGTDLFGVGDTLTRGQLATILWRNACPDEAKSYDPETAVDETGIAGSADGMFYTAAANWAVREGVITGFEREDGMFDFAADSPVTFEQLITILARVGADEGDVAAAGSDLSAFVDGVQVDAWAAPALAWAAKNGLVTGYIEEDGPYLRPVADVTRERVAVVLMRAFELDILK